MSRDPFFTKEQKEEIYNKLLEKSGIEKKSDVEVRFKKYKRVSLISYAAVLVLAILLTVVVTSMVNADKQESNKAILSVEEVEYVESFGGYYDNNVYAELTGYNDSKLYIIMCNVNGDFYYFVKSTFDRLITIELTINGKKTILNEEFSLVFQTDKETQYKNKMIITIDNQVDDVLEYSLYL